VGSLQRPYWRRRFKGFGGGVPAPFVPPPPPGIVYINSTAANNSVNAGSLSIVYASTTAGDLLLLLVVNNSGPAPTISAPGFTLAPSAWPVDGNNTTLTNVLYRFCDGTESGSVLVSLSAGTAHWALAMNAYRNVDQTNPFEATPLLAAGTGSGTAPTVTTTDLDDWVVSLFGGRNTVSQNTFTATSGTLRVDSESGTSSPFLSAAIVDSNAPLNAGTYGYAGTYANAPGVNQTAGTLALKLAGSAPPPVTFYGATTPGLSQVSPAGPIRCYGSAPSTPAGTLLCLSDTAYVAAHLSELASGTVAVINHIIADFTPGGNLRDDANHLFDPFHEPDNNSGISITTFAAAMAVFATSCWPSIAALYTHAVTWGPIFTGEWYGGGTDVNGHTRNNAYRNSWLAGYTPQWLGSDPYATIALITDTYDYCAPASGTSGQGLPFYFTEFGTATTSNPTDAQHLTHMQDGIAANIALPVPAGGFFWYDANHNLLDTTLVNSTALHAVQIVVPNLPGPGNDGTPAYPSGSPIYVGGAGVGADDVKTTGASSSAGGGNFDVPVQSLGHTHAAGDPVWIMPTALAYWLSLQP
jgi:hypothetical protein